MATQDEPRRFTVDDYHRMAGAGILTEDDRVELIEGEIVQMSAAGSRHVACVYRWDDLLHEQIERGSAIISVQSPVRLDNHSEPEPDIAALRFRADYYSGALATAADVLLLVEVADTSLAYDRGVKLPTYARAGVPEVWLVDLLGERIERHTDPSERGYRLIARASRGESLESIVLPSLKLAVDDVLG